VLLSIAIVSVAYPVKGWLFPVSNVKEISWSVKHLEVFCASTFHAIIFMSQRIDYS